ncbi:hypothetical protein DL766_006336 [Monosporascus sp. MC13-8B]|uniref:NACHT-NTPase and P-loop NTPases N-terminal domain-containing protein n=1 Tax=Monosporascus cannonballus TaxID=155416 RepID=A0ABY0H204_9PEZI|nr:hypothetical protein DL762_006586 [Monosporascus cannonballus]RYO90177.1 hypothetical protein DL763_005418 [Monosporascus cannonballus]RYP27552.1 hypothetical protein DL766_006336 [Monosporascus sp. MC13-8B]
MAEALVERFCDEVKDVPEDIADLLQQIDCLDPALWEAENSFESTGLPAMLWNDAAAKRSTTYCRNALKALTEIVDEMAAQIKHHRRLNRKVASVKVVLRKDTLKKLEKRLENAVRMLTLAQQSYLTEVFEVTGNGVPHDLQRMFDMGLASPFDYESRYGGTLLHIALQRKNLAMVPYLLSKGLDLWAKDHYGIAWVGSLKAAGINVTGYGCREMELLRDTSLTRDSIPCLGYYQECKWDVPDPVWRGVSIRLMGYKYGPEPEDWDVYWSEPTDEFAGDFWELVENPPLQVPGAWDPSFDDET